MADSKKYNGSTWEHSLRKLGTATEAVENPLYSDGTAITAYTIKGNTVQNGTPTPSNPVDVNGVGVGTGNLFDKSTITTGNFATLSGTNASNSYYCSDFIPITAATYYFQNIVGGSYQNSAVVYDANKQGLRYESLSGRDKASGAITFQSGDAYIRINCHSTTDVDTVMANEGSTAKPYEPYGYKIPISSGGVTTNIYLTEQLMKIGDTADSLVSAGTVTYNIKKLVLTGNEEYSNDWRPATGTYAALIKISNTIPESDNVIPICTHLQGKHYDYLFSGEVGVSRVPSSVYCIAIRVPDTIAANQSELVSWLAAQYTNGTPVIVYYVIATAETETVTAPSIPTTEGANSITVDTTVQPSEFTATWTGWHDAEVKEYISTTTITDWESMSISQMENHTIQELYGGNWT